MATHGRVKLDPGLILHTERNSEWIDVLNVRVKTIQLLGGNNLNRLAV